MSKARQIAVNALSQWVLLAVGAALGILLVPFLIGKLGQEYFGLMTVILTIMATCLVAEVGISQSLSRHLAECLARDDVRGYSAYVTTAAGINLALGVVLAGVVLATAGPLADLFGIPDAMRAEAISIIGLLAVGYLPMALLSPIPRAVLASHGRFDIDAWLGGLRKIFQAGSLFLVLGALDMSLIGWGLVSVLTELLTLGVLALAARKVHGRPMLTMARLNGGALRELYSLGSQFLLLQISGELNITLNPVLLSAVLGPASVALYRPPGQILGLFAPIILTLGNQMCPFATKAHVAQSALETRQILIRGTKYTVLMGGVFCAMLVPMAYPICRVWLGKALGPDYIVSAHVMVLQGLTFLLMFAAGTQWAVLLGMKRTKFAAVSRLVLSIINFATAYAMLRFTSWGIIAVVIPGFILEALWRPVIARFVCRKTGIAWGEYLREAYLPALLASAPVAAVGLLAQHMLPLASIWQLLAVTAGMGVLGAAMIWTVGFNATDRASMLNVIRRRSARVAPPAQPCPQLLSIVNEENVCE